MFFTTKICRIRLYCDFSCLHSQLKHNVKLYGKRSILEYIFQHPRCWAALQLEESMETCSMSYSEVIAIKPLYSFLILTKKLGIPKMVSPYCRLELQHNRSFVIKFSERSVRKMGDIRKNNPSQSIFYCKTFPSSVSRNQQFVNRRVTKRSGEN